MMQRDLLDYFKTVWPQSQKVVELGRPEAGSGGSSIKTAPVMEVGVHEWKARQTLAMNRATAPVKRFFRLHVYVLTRKKDGQDAGWSLCSQLDAKFQNKMLVLNGFSLDFETALTAPPEEIEKTSAWIFPWKCDFTNIIYPN